MSTFPGLNRAQAREVDRRAVDEFGLPSIVLMENAGRGCVDKLIQLGLAGPVVVCCGPGNNGGDGFVIARHLDLRHVTVKLALFAPRNRYQGDAAVNLAVVEKSGIEAVDFSTDFTNGALDTFLGQPGCIVDALLGTGFCGEVRQPLAQAIDRLNAAPAPKIAIDLPSGLDCDTGLASTHTIRATHTLTFVAMKRGFGNPASVPYTGEVHVLDIGAPRRLVDEIVQRAR